MNEEDYKIAYETVVIANKMLQKENQKLKKIIDDLEKFCNDEIKNGIKTDFGEETVGISFKQTLTSYEFILNKLAELKKRSEINEYKRTF